jgi:hypothetical protein
MAPVAMLLLDHYLPHQLRDLLTTFGLESETAILARMGADAKRRTGDSGPWRRF